MIKRRSEVTHKEGGGEEGEGKLSQQSWAKVEGSLEIVTWKAKTAAVTNKITRYRKRGKNGLCLV